jgi:hypothetical protein
MGRTVMSFTERAAWPLVRLAGALAAAAALAGCTTPDEVQAQADFGRALHEDILAQTTNPEAGEGAARPPPAADGSRVGLAMHRYQTGKVIEPQPATASKIGVYGVEASIMPPSQ